MNTINEIKDAILKLPEDEAWLVHDWLVEHCSDLWDKQIERDVKAGKWDKMVREAHEEYDSGKCTELTPQARPSDKKAKIDSVEVLQAAVRQLSEQGLNTFRPWFFEYDAEVWDREFEEDVRLGRLDKFGDQAEKDMLEGKCREL